MQSCFDHPLFDSGLSVNEVPGIENRPFKRKRDEIDHDTFNLSLSRMKHILAVERDSFIADIDDLTISLNLHQLETSTKFSSCQPKSIESQSIEARQGNLI